MSLDTFFIRHRWASSKIVATADGAVAVVDDEYEDNMRWISVEHYHVNFTHNIT